MWRSCTLTLTGPPWNTSYAPTLHSTFLALSIVTYIGPTTQTIDHPEHRDPNEFLNWGRKFLCAWIHAADRKLAQWERRVVMCLIGKGDGGSSRKVGEASKEVFPPPRRGSRILRLRSCLRNQTSQKFASEAPHSAHKRPSEVCPLVPAPWIFLKQCHFRWLCPWSAMWNDSCSASWISALHALCDMHPGIGAARFGPSGKQARTLGVGERTFHVIKLESLKAPGAPDMWASTNRNISTSLQAFHVSLFSLQTQTLQDLPKPYQICAFPKQVTPSNLRYIFNNHIPLLDSYQSHIISVPSCGPKHAETTAPHTSDLHEESEIAHISQQTCRTQRSSNLIPFYPPAFQAS